jgi:hypothetical protein
MATRHITLQDVLKLLGASKTALQLWSKYEKVAEGMDYRFSIGIWAAYNKAAFAALALEKLLAAQDSPPLEAESSAVGSFSCPTEWRQAADLLVKALIDIRGPDALDGWGERAAGGWLKAQVGKSVGEIRFPSLTNPIANVRTAIELLGDAIAGEGGRGHAAVETESDESVAGQGKASSEKKRKRGPKPKYDAKDNERIYDAWNQDRTAPTST